MERVPLTFIEAVSYDACTSNEQGPLQIWTPFSINVIVVFDDQTLVFPSLTMIRQGDGSTRFTSFKAGKAVPLSAATVMVG